MPLLIPWIISLWKSPILQRLPGHAPIMFRVLILDWMMKSILLPVRLVIFCSVKLYVALNDYYNVSDHWKNRFSIFKNNLLQETGAPLEGLAYGFAGFSVKAEIFESQFGHFKNFKYAGIISQTFSDKIDRLIATKESQKTPFIQI